MKSSLRNRYVFSAVFAAMIAVSGFFIVPLPGGVPIVLKNLFIILSGTVLGGFYGSISVLVFIAAGLAGIPVFVIPGGPGVFFTPLGGFIIGYFFASLIAGIICGIPKVCEKKISLNLILRIFIASFSGFTLILACGVFYMMRLNSITLSAAIAAGVLPFLPGDLIKLVIGIPLALKLRPIAARYINNEE
ncbi:MAG: biotin transporter BioY [Treponema sp.]|nr:biotin transporter BioY [Treponema sp.]